MNDHESFQTIEQSRPEPRMCARAKATITVQSSEALPYDQTVSPELVEIRLKLETFTGDIDGESPVRASQVATRTMNLPALSACNGSAEEWADAAALSCFKVQKSSRVARSRRDGLSFPDRGQVIFLGCGARAALKGTLERDLTERSIIGSNDVATITDSPSDRRTIPMCLPRCPEPSHAVETYRRSWNRMLEHLRQPLNI